MPTVEVLHRFEDFLAVEAEWHALFAAAAFPHAALRHGWLRVGWAMHGQGRANRLRVVLVREAGELMMAGAFILGVRRVTPTVRFLGSGMPQYNDVLWRASPDTARHADLLLAGLRRGLLLPHRLRFDRMPAASPFLAALRRAGRTGRSVAEAPIAFIRTENYDGFAAYYAGLSQGFRDDHARRLRRLGELPGFRIGPETGDSLRTTLSWMFDTKRDWLVRKHHNAGWLSGGLVDRFFPALIDSGDAPGLLVFTLRLGDPVAALLVTVERDSAVLVKVAHDPAYEKHSPGRTLILELVRLAFERGLPEIDFGQVNDWKRRFQPSYRDVAEEYLWL